MRVTFRLALLAALVIARGALAQETPAGSPADPPSPSASAEAAPAESASPSAAPSPGSSNDVSLSSTPSIQPSSAVPGSFIVKEGDVVAGKSRDGKVRVMKVVKINFIEGDRLLHAIAYKETFHSYDEAAAALAAHKLTTLIFHLPIDGEGLTADANKVLANEPVTEKELEGYKEYLKETGPAPSPKR